jgi:signal transduction histidine kinase
MSLAGRISRAVDTFIRRPAWWPALIAFWALFTLASYAWHIHDLENYAHTMAALRGRLVFEMVETTRLWASQHGGVYAPVTDTTPPNPYLDVPEKTISTPSGKQLTKINPAYMTRQLGDLIARERDMRIHLTSLNPINPDNAPDEWEATALTGFETDRAERISIVGAGDTASFRYMAPLEARKPCLACHAKQGYREGDIRGGISVTFPASYIYGIIDEQRRGFRYIHFAAFAILSLLAWGSLAAIRRHLLALEAARGELVETEKMASLGRMVAGFAHEVNTPVGVAVGAVSHSRQIVTELGALLSKEEVTEEELRERMSQLDEASALAMSNLSRAAAMVQSFKRTSVDQTSEAERDYDLAELIDDVLQNLRSSFKRTSIQISVRCPPNLKLHGAAGALEQLLSNLINNSRIHAFADGTRSGTIALVSSVQDDRVKIDYSDDGAGMSSETIEHAFEPFYTTRRGSGGSGLGLFIAYGLATRELHGSITCSSSAGKGTRFIIEFPGNQRNDKGAH